jgi:hypothetical protein
MEKAPVNWMPIVIQRSFVRILNRATLPERNGVVGQKDDNRVAR